MLLVWGIDKRNVCPQLASFKRCNNCGKEGHFGRDCPNLTRTLTRPSIPAPAQNQQRRGSNRPQASNIVYAMTRAEVAGSGNLVMGRCVIADKSACVLYDSRVTHSFVSETCVQRLGLPVCELQCNLVMSTPASG